MADSLLTRALALLRCWRYRSDRVDRTVLMEQTDALLAEAATTPDEGEWHDGVARIAAERRRQVEGEHWTPKHDDAHRKGEMAGAAACYALMAAGFSYPNLIEARRPTVTHEVPLWPWAAAWWKPSDDPIRNLTKAGALIAAEIDRLLRREVERTPASGGEAKVVTPQRTPADHPPAECPYCHEPGPLIRCVNGWQCRECRGWVVNETFSASF